MFILSLVATVSGLFQDLIKPTFLEDDILSSKFSPLENFIVKVRNSSDNTYLPYEEPKITLNYQSKSEDYIGYDEAVFKLLPKSFFEDSVTVEVESYGFKTIDTTFIPRRNFVIIDLIRDNSYEEVFGRVENNGVGVPNMLVVVAGKFREYTDDFGFFRISIPESSQRKRQSIEVMGSPNFKEKKVIESIIKDAEIIIELEKV